MGSSMIIRSGNKISSTKSAHELKSFIRKYKVMGELEYSDKILREWYRVKDTSKLKYLGVHTLPDDDFHEASYLVHRASYPISVKSSGVKQVSDKKRERNAVRDEFFRGIWESRPHKSEVSGKPLDYKFGKHMYFVFSHVVTKAAYPALEYLSDNIVLMTREEHHTWEFSRHKVEDDPKWKFVFDLHDKLIADYWKSKNN